MKDRLPPFSEQSEKAVIGCCLTDPVTCIPKVSAVATVPEFFYSAGCREPWQIMLAMEPSAVNIITIGDGLKMVGGHTFLGECQDAAFSSSNLPVWLEEVNSKYTMRRLIKVATEAIAAAYDSPDSNTTLDQFEREVLKIRTISKSGSNIRQIVHEALKEIEERFKMQGSISGISTGLPDLDVVTDGLHGGEVVVIAAFPSFGKTALAMNIVEHVVLDLKKPVGVFSAEMSSKSLVVRCICSRGRVNMRDIREGNLGDRDFPRILSAAGSLAESNLIIDDTCGLTTSQLRQRARRMKQEHNIELLVADYAQLFSSAGAENRTNEVDQVSKCFKGISKELNIPVILLSQLTDTGNGGIKTKNASAIEEDADGLWLLKRPNGDVETDVSCAMELWLKKQRNGPRNVCVNLTFLKPYTRFESAARIEHEPETRYADT